MPNLKIPVFNKELDYFDVKIDNQRSLELKNEDVNGLKWRDLQKLIGKKLGRGGLFNYQMKWKNSDQPITGKIRAMANISDDDLKTKTSDLNPFLLQKLNDVENKLKNISTASPDSSVVMDIMRASYEARIDGYKERISELKTDKIKLESEIDKLNDELDNYEEKIRELEGGKLDTYLNLFEKIGMMKLGKVKPLSDFTGTNHTDIPKQILDVLGLVDYERISNEQLNKILDMLKMWVQEFPLKQNIGVTNVIR